MQNPNRSNEHSLILLNPAEMNLTSAPLELNEQKRVLLLRELQSQFCAAIGKTLMDHYDIESGLKIEIGGEDVTEPWPTMCFVPKPDATEDDLNHNSKRLAFFFKHLSKEAAGRNVVPGMRGAFVMAVLQYEPADLCDTLGDLMMKTFHGENDEVMEHICNAAHIIERLENYVPANQLN